MILWYAIDVKTHDLTTSSLYICHLTTVEPLTKIISDIYNIISGMLYTDYNRCYSRCYTRYYNICYNTYMLYPYYYIHTTIQTITHTIIYTIVHMTSYIQMPWVQGLVIAYKACYIQMSWFQVLFWFWNSCFGNIPVMHTMRKLSSIANQWPGRSRPGQSKFGI